MAEIIMPKMGDQMTEGKLIAWNKKEGDRVERGEPVAVIETEKANVDVEAEESGTLTRILLKEGETAPVGAAIAEIDGATGAARADRPAQVAEERAGRMPPPPAAHAPSRETTAPARPEPHPSAPGSAIAERTAEAAAAKAAAAPEAREVRAPSERIKASPLARRLATEHGVDLRQVRGTGPGGRIEKRDVEQFRQMPAAAAAAPGAAFEDRELSRMRQAIARNMTASKPGAPHIYLTVDVEMDAALALRRELNDIIDDERQKLTVNDIVVKAAALALRKNPEINAWYLDEQPPKVRLFRDVNVGVAVPVEGGLQVPVIRNADTKSLSQLAADAKDIYDRIRAGRPRADDFTGGTFTTSNLGPYGIDEFQAIINPPQAGILAVGAASPKPVVRNGEMVVRTIMRVTLSSDHRVVDGVVSARYLQEFKRLLEAPLSLAL